MPCKLKILLHCSPHQTLVETVRRRFMSRFFDELIMADKDAHMQDTGIGESNADNNDLEDEGDEDEN